MKLLSKEEMMNVNAGATYVTNKCQYCHEKQFSESYISWLPINFPFAYNYAKVRAESQLHEHELNCIGKYL